MFQHALANFAGSFSLQSDGTVTKSQWLAVSSGEQTAISDLSLACTICGIRFLSCLFLFYERAAGQLA
jgi:hypothetical protein